MDVVKPGEVGYSVLQTELEGMFADLNVINSSIPYPPAYDMIRSDLKVFSSVKCIDSLVNIYLDINIPKYQFIFDALKIIKDKSNVEDTNAKSKNLKSKKSKTSKSSRQANKSLGSILVDSCLYLF